jgi:hypothetical protein
LLERLSCLILALFYIFHPSSSIMHFLQIQHNTPSWSTLNVAHSMKNAKQCSSPTNNKQHKKNRKHTIEIRSALKASQWPIRCGWAQMIQNWCQNVNFLQFLLHLFMWCHFNGMWIIENCVYCIIWY